MTREPRDWKQLIELLRGLERVDVAQFMAQAIDEMAGNNVSADEIAHTCTSICRKLGVEAADLRRALN